MFSEIPVDIVIPVSNSEREVGGVLPPKTAVRGNAQKEGVPVQKEVGLIVF